MAKHYEGQKVVCANKKARLNYHVLEIMQAGIVLTGTELKSLRLNRATISEANVGIKNGEAFLYNCHIAEYSHGNIWNHAPLRIRKLLLHKKEIMRLVGFVKEKGQTIIPLKMYFEKGKVKVDIAQAQGKKLYDKREDMKKKTADREIAQSMKRNLH